MLCRRTTKDANRHYRDGWALMIALILVLTTGCASTARRQPINHQFELGRDSFSYANELLWEYEPDPLTGKMNTRPRDPKPTYRNYCFVMARAARQFFDFAEFDPTQPQADEPTYAQLIRKVISRDPRSDPSRKPPIVIPGYANLHEFSRAHEAQLKELCGSNWQSFVQRGHWRVVFPFSDGHQAGMAQRLQHELGRGIAPVVHLIRFPEQTINHGVLVYRATETLEGVQLLCYDPNNPEKSLELNYRREDQRFYTPQNSYYIGGRVDVYEVYRNWLY